MVKRYSIKEFWGNLFNWGVSFWGNIKLALCVSGEAYLIGEI